MTSPERNASSDGAASLVEALRDPACYPHPVQHVELVETHISWVLLTGSFAYKIKKPVDLGFVDFSTLERRRHFCAEELRLNRRLAPQLYLEVVPIGGRPDAPRLGGSPAIEYAVRMRQFPGQAEAPAALARGALGAAHFEHLADDLAAFHAAVEVAPPQGAHGGAGEIRAETLDNFTALEPCLGAGLAGGVLEPLRAWSERTLAARAAAFEQRRRQGFVRECHGDLHLGNLALIADRLVAFDCIEFNEDLRWTDVAAEIAFLVMDLDYRGHGALAHRFLDRYLERTGDYGALRVLRHYLVYRAMVRAKVACIRLRQAGGDVRTEDRAREELERHAALARRYTRGFPSTPLVITRGLSGSGKSWLAQRLVDAGGAVRIRSDVERKRLHGLAPGTPAGAAPESGLYTPAATARTYARLAELARGVIEAGWPVIVDATFLERERREAFRRLAAALGVRFVILDLEAPAALLRQRVAGRRAAGEGTSDADLAVLGRQQEKAEPLAAGEAAFAIRVDTAQEVDVAALAGRLLEGDSRACGSRG